MPYDPSFVAVLYLLCCEFILFHKLFKKLLRGMRKGSEIGRCPLCYGEEDAVHILLKCPETRRLREHLMSRK
jgi:hypothetical protein